jgi:Kef-type K+ transport system membrane component KefB
MLKHHHRRSMSHLLTSRRLLPLVTIILLPLHQASAGMPSVTMEEVSEMRLESISFFAFALLGFTWLIKLAWNFLRKDFPKLPQISYLRALTLVFLIGCLFMLILTMISGARELLTPGAWKKQGFTYKLNE